MIVVVVPDGDADMPHAVATQTQDKLLECVLEPVRLDCYLARLERIVWNPTGALLCEVINTRRPVIGDSCERVELSCREQLQLAFVE